MSKGAAFRYGILRLKLAVVGTGYVGLVTAACLAELGHEVIGVDIDAEKVRKLQAGECPIYEPGLEELLREGLRSGRLSFTTNLQEALPGTAVVFSAVATPPNEDFSADLKAVFSVCESVASNADHDLVFVNKSTVPVGTGAECEKRIAVILKERRVPYRIPVISNPEFLREGFAVQDTLQPDRVIVGINGDASARKLMEEIYSAIVRVGKPLVFMSRESAEIVKYASNAFLATKISFSNMLSELCEVTGGNIRDIAKGMGLDDRIGPRFLHAGIGYGGSCFPKDVKALIQMSKKFDVPLPIVEATHAVNERQRRRFFRKILTELPRSSTVGVWGLSFKPRTDDMREAPSLDLIPLLLEAGNAVQAYDPAAMENAKRVLPKKVLYVRDPLEAAKGANAVVVLTEWDVFRGMSLSEVKAAMKGRHLFDGRNVYDPQEVRVAGLIYHGIGV